MVTGQMGVTGNDTQEANEAGVLYISHNTETDAWAIAAYSELGDAEVTWGIDASGQVNYTSSAFAGTGYVGTLRLLGKQQFAQ